MNKEEIEHLESIKKAVDFTAKIAKMKRGSAPSSGYMQELINEARNILQLETRKCGDCDNFISCEVNSGDDACDEFKDVSISV